MTENTHLSRSTFDREADLYDQARPGYPPQLFDDLINYAHLLPVGRILEIGCGTGQATLPLARRGYPILCVELGANLAAVARRNLAPYPQVSFYTGAFENWPLEPAAFDLALSATAFHWIDPAVGYPKMAQALRPGGTLALCWNRHVHSDAGAGFFAEAHEVYRCAAPAIASASRTPIPRAEELAASGRAEIEATGYFSAVTVCRYPWEVTYDAESYLRLLNTYSDHLSLAPDTRQRLFDSLIELISRRFAGQVTKGYLTVLYLAHRQ